MYTNSKAKTIAKADKRINALIAVIEQKKGDISAEKRAVKELRQIGSK
jgi:hypothetical protein